VSIGDCRLPIVTAILFEASEYKRQKLSAQ
jgi:hypothetical protein